MSYERPVVLSVAGYDPSGGAGVLADVKTFEQHRCLGMAVITAWTVQTEDRFSRLEPFGTEQIMAQLEPLLCRYPVSYLKVGLFPDAGQLLLLLQWLKILNPEIRIVWDPVLSASAGYAFAGGIDKELLQQLLRHIYLLTPNVAEARSLADTGSELDAAARLSEHCMVLLKGGHSAAAPGTDYLYSKGNRVALPPAVSGAWPKHGSGCILSAAITAQLALGAAPEQACRLGKQYIEQVLNSNPQLLAYHVV